MDPSNLTPEHSNSDRSTEAPRGSRTRPKQTIDDYEFVIDQNSKFKTSDLGSGAYGKVKRVREIVTGQIYAMKIMDKTAVFRSSSKENLKNEIQIHKNIQHPHIIKLHNYFEDSEYVYIVMEYAENRSLYEFIRKGFAENEAFVFFFQTCLGLKYLHSKMIIHRDLKPENLLLDKENNVKICDFGWSTRGSNVRQTYCGTLDYMAPEIIKDLPYDHRVDIWSLGILLYELLHGCVPFFGQTDQQKTHSIASNTPIRFSPRISTEACNFITKILKPNPEDRLTLDEILMHPWMKKHEEVYDVNIQSYVERQEIETKKAELLLHGNPDSGRGNRATQRNIIKAGLDIGEIKKKSSGDTSTQPNSRSESEKNDVQNQTGNKKNKPLPGHGQASEYWWASVDVPILGLKTGTTRKDDSLNEERGRDQYSIDSDPSEKKGSEIKRYSSMDRRGRSDGIERKRTSKYFDMNLNVHQGNMGDIKGLNDIVFKNTEIERQLQSRKKDDGPNFFEQMLMGFGIISKNNNKGNEF